MSTNLINGCSYSQIWVHPNNWQTVQGKKAAATDWYVECKYYDPRFTSKYPKGFPFRKKLNGIKDIAERRDRIRSLLQEIPYIFEVLHFNPIPAVKGYMAPPTVKLKGYVDRDTPVTDAFAYALTRIPGAPKYITQARYAVNRVSKVFAANPPLRISEMRYSHFSDAIDSLRLPVQSYNHYRDFFRAIFKVLIKNDCCVQNWAVMLEKARIVKKPREILSDEQFAFVMDHLKTKCYEFYRYAMIFFMSGTRTTELLSIRTGDVRLRLQEYDVLIQKGKSTAVETKVIIEEAAGLWAEILALARPGDYLFSRGLIPGNEPLQPRRISDRWRTHVKEELGITADFYALKHKFLDMLDARQTDGKNIDKETFQAIQSLNLAPEITAKILMALGAGETFDVAQRMAAHKSSSITNKVYKVNRDKRERETLKKIRIDLKNVN